MRFVSPSNDITIGKSPPTDPLPGRFKHQGGACRWVNVIRVAIHFGGLPWWCAAALVLAAGGCSSISLPWIESDESNSAADHRYGARHAVVVGELSNPSHNPTGWTDIGRKLSQAVRQRLSERSDLQVRDEPALAARAQNLIAMSGEQRTDEIKSLASQWPGVRYVMTGRVVDFRHATHTPTDLSRWDASRSRTHAIVAVKLEIFDLHQRRMIASDTVEARSWADQTPFEQTYRGVSFGTQRFWTTPLGLASRDAIARCAQRFDEVAPPVHEPPIRIVSKINDRRVRLNIDAKSRVKKGDVLWVCEYDSSGTRLQPVIDPVTRQPVQAKVESRGVLPSAWLLGQPPADVNLTRTVLLATKP